jgi:site-specific DNA-methyltransferase (adenine-specific)
MYPDIITKNNNYLYFGDCLDVMPNHILDKSIDLILCDLPYNTTNCSWDLAIDLPKLWIQYERIIKDNGAILLTAQTPFDKILGASNLKLLRYEWIWEKTQATGHLNSKEMPMKAHENVLVFYKKLPTYNPIMTEGHVRKVSKAKNRAACIERRNNTDNIYNNEYPDKVNDYDSTTRFPRSVIVFKTDKQKCNLHKTQKPLDLMKYFIQTYSNENDVVLDNAMGSGTTCLASAILNRRFIGIDNDPKSYNTTIERLKQNDYL